ncbi:AraC family ligand binding domain-containing protein [Flavobacteriaceae bacterium XHP0103]|uniref:type I phosphomannose isomerase catalytic subunit n=1 Tax=Marixanthotalea marina TaxID=2844359 RepID=UPI002989E53D|nr:type I phosphomannose isomerase catalytic subunit [Marixanthotalea marina]MBU3821040.1 AraC family ligand binding domain-containing protein [Marixanthotalea marina]
MASNASDLYPLKFQPIFTYRMWGGDKLKTVLHKNYTEESIGESWEISDVEDNETEVSEGHLKGRTLRDLIKDYQEDFVGTKVYRDFGDEFPLLIKYIDAKTPLSIQVHPNNELARERHNSFGKNEMWYIMQADDDAELIVGFNKEVTEKEYVEHVENATVTDILNIEKVSKGDTFYIPTGRVHAIGAGVLLAEIQQTSNITYRIYDYDRVDAKTGEKRELHTALAVDAIDYNFYDTYKTDYEVGQNEASKLVHSPYFKTNIVEVKGELAMDYAHLDSFVIYMCVEGAAVLECNGKNYSLNKGETILLPAAIKQVVLMSKEKSRVLEVSL